MKAFVVSCATFVVLGCGTSEPAPSYSEPSSSEPRVVDPVRREERRICDDNTAVLIGRLYFVTNPINEQTEPRRIEEFVAANAALLDSNSAFVSCAGHAGARLTAAAYSSFDPRQSDQAYGRALEMGASMEDANKVRDSLNSGSLELLGMGQEIIWLSRVIPSAAAGDWQPFLTVPATQARQGIREVWPLVSSVTSPSDIGIVRAAFDAYQPWLVYQIAVLVAQMG